MITPEMIEAGARAARQSHLEQAVHPDDPATYMGWDAIPEDARERWRNAMRAALEAAERAAVSEEPVGYATQDDLDAIADGTVISVGLMWPDVIRERRGDYLVPLYTRPLPSPPEAPKGEE